MAEAWVKHGFPDCWEARSAGTRPGEQVHPLAIRVMAEAGIDLSAGAPESLEVYLDQSWDLVITVCDSARQSCPVFPGAVKTLHSSFNDPAEATGSEEEQLAVFRRVRDEIKERLATLLNISSA